MTTPSRWDVRVAVIYQDRVTFIQSRNTWREVTVTVSCDPYDEKAAIEAAKEKAPRIEGLTVIGGAIVGDSARAAGVDVRVVSYDGESSK